MIDGKDAVDLVSKLAETFTSKTLLFAVLPFGLLLTLAFSACCLWLRMDVLMFVPTKPELRMAGIAFVVSAIAFSIYLVFIGVWLALKQVRVLKLDQKRKRDRSDRRISEEERLKSQVLAELEGLSSKEQLLLAEGLLTNSRTLTKSLTYAPAQALCQKGLLDHPSGLIMQQEAQFCIPLFVWKHLQRHKDEFLQKSGIRNGKLPAGEQRKRA